MGVEFPAPLRDDCVREDLPFVIDEDDLCSVEEDRLPRGKKSLVIKSWKYLNLKV